MKFAHAFPGIVACLCFLASTSGCKRAEAPPAASRSVSPGERTEMTVRTAEGDGPEQDVIVVSEAILDSCGVAGENAYFAVDSAELRPGGEERLDAIAECLIEGPLAQRSIVLVGYTDPRGSESYNADLGMARARAVASYLRGHGVSSLKMETVSHGQEGASEDESTWPKQRRVEIKLVAKDSTLTPSD